MRKCLISIAVILLFLILVSCASSSDNQSFPYGYCQIRGWGGSNELVFQGTLYIDQSDSITFDGNWNIWRTRDYKSGGFQFGSGYLTGYIENNKMYVNLSPDIPNLDFELNGIVYNNEIRGDWIWEDRARVGMSGTFILNKN
ncbi:MAG: hypothetical protein PVF17_04640 [Ignavibacteria bacterium]|jgi:hypothetical protein